VSSTTWKAGGDIASRAVGAHSRVHCSSRPKAAEHAEAEEHERDDRVEDLERDRAGERQQVTLAERARDLAHGFAQRHGSKLLGDTLEELHVPAPYPPGVRRGRGASETSYDAVPAVVRAESGVW